MSTFNVVLHGFLFRTEDEDPHIKSVTSVDMLERLVGPDPKYMAARQCLFEHVNPVMLLYTETVEDLLLIKDEIAQVIWPFGGDCMPVNIEFVLHVGSDFESAADRGKIVALVTLFNDEFQIHKSPIPIYVTFEVR